jgi:hypothetical protein
MGDKEGRVVQAKQATSLRVDQMLYDRLARLARDRGTSITRQVETAVQAHLEHALMQDHLPVIEPTMARIINANLEATITAKIDEVKQRLAGLLAKNAMDTAVLYLLETRRWSADERQAWRKAAADHVRGRLAEWQADAVLEEEIAGLRRQVEELKGQLRRQEQAFKDAATRHEAEKEHLEEQVEGLHRVLVWKNGLIKWLEVEWEKSGLLGRRKPFQSCVGEFEGQTPKPIGA